MFKFTFRSQYRLERDPHTGQLTGRIITKPMESDFEHFATESSKIVSGELKALRDQNATLRAFVEDVRDSKLRASSDEECVMAFVRLGNAAKVLLEALAEGKRDE